MTDYTDLKHALRQMGNGTSPITIKDAKSVVSDAANAIAALEAEVARASAIAHKAIDEWASWVHDQLDGTSGLAEAIAEVDAARADLADQPVTGSPR